MIRELARIGEAEVEKCSIRFHLQDGQEVTPGKWVVLMKRGNIPMITASLEYNLPPDLVVERSSSSSRSSSTTSLAPSRTGGGAIVPFKPITDENDNGEAQSQATRNDTRRFLLLSSEPKISMGLISKERHDQKLSTN